MSAIAKLHKAQQTNRTHICLGLDLDPRKMPSEFGGKLKGMFDFAHRIIDATSDKVCAYKPNLAFYESHGPDGLSLLQLIVERIPEHIPIIIDGKRNDIGNTANHYAQALFDRYRADWVTINPYMGYDSMRPFLERKDKGAFVLCLTSNPGSKDFQQLNVDGRPLYAVVADRVNYWNKDQNCGLVVGATHPEQLKTVRELAGDMPLLIPGVGAQGGSLEQAITAGSDNFRKPAVINVSRSVLYASNKDDFAQRARQELEKLNGIITGLRQASNVGSEPASLPVQSPPEPDRVVVATEPEGAAPVEKPSLEPTPLQPTQPTESAPPVAQSPPEQPRPTHEPTPPQAPPSPPPVEPPPPPSPPTVEQQPLQEQPRPAHEPPVEPTPPTHERPTEPTPQPPQEPASHNDERPDEQTPPPSSGDAPNS